MNHSLFIYNIFEKRGQMKKKFKRLAVIFIISILFFFVLPYFSSSQIYLPSTTIWSSLEPGTNSFFVNNLDIAVTTVYFNLIEGVELSSMRAQRVDNLREFFPGTKDTPYQFINISKSGIKDSNIKSIIIKFRVEKSWIEKNNIDEFSINLYKKEDDWKLQETKKTEKEDRTYYYYDSWVSSFGWFYIGGSPSEQKENIVDRFEPDDDIAPILEEDLKKENNNSRMIFLIIIFVFLAIGVVYINKEKIFSKKIDNPLSSNSSDMIGFIEQSKAQGDSYNEIKNHLLSKGWNEAEIMSALEDVSLPEDQKSMMANYISSSLKKGKLRRDIKKELMVTGWSEDIIEEVFKDIM